jgi:hypothetical protein
MRALKLANPRPWEAKLVIAFGSNALCRVPPPVIAAIESLFIGLSGTTTSTDSC